MAPLVSFAVAAEIATFIQNNFWVYWVRKSSLMQYCLLRCMIVKICSKLTVLHSCVMHRMLLQAISHTFIFVARHSKCHGNKGNFAPGTLSNWIAGQYRVLFSLLPSRQTIYGTFSRSGQIWLVFRCLERKRRHANFLQTYAEQVLDAETFTLARLFDWYHGK